MSHAKRFCYTLNNYNDEEESSLQRFTESECIYAIVGREVGERGTPHLQGFFILRKSSTFKACLDRLFPRIHLEVARGTPRQNREYCRKGGDFTEQGDLGALAASGASHDRDSRDEIGNEFVERMESGRSGLVRFASERRSTYLWHGSTLLRNWLYVQPAVHRPDVSVQWFVGLPGTGKSKRAHELLPEAYIKDPRTKWWNGYLLEEDVIIDDFGPGGIDINHLLRWFDRYKCTVESKGGMLPLYATNIIVTSNFQPHDVFNHKVYDNMDHTNYDHPQLPALMRRIKMIVFE